MLDVLKRRRRYSEPEARFYLVQLIQACHYMHSRSVIHRDLKLGNLFLDEQMNLCVGDFGLAALVRFPGERKKTICGTPNYIAPEILFDRDNGHSFEVDIWSIGVILYTCLVGKPPFQTKEVKEIYQKIKENAYTFPDNLVISNEAIDLISSILNNDPGQRPSLGDILTHPFFHPSNPFPHAIPISALHKKPDFSNLTPSQSAANLRHVQAASSAFDDSHVDSNDKPLPSAPQPTEVPQAVAKQVAQAQETEVRHALAPESPISELLNSARKPLVVSPAGRERRERAERANREQYDLAKGREGGKATGNRSPFAQINGSTAPSNARVESLRSSVVDKPSCVQQPQFHRQPSYERQTVKQLERVAPQSAAALEEAPSPRAMSSREVYEMSWKTIETALAARTSAAIEAIPSESCPVLFSHRLTDWLPQAHLQLRPQSSLHLGSTIHISMALHTN